jgi:hypothetical protein
MSRTEVFQVPAGTPYPDQAFYTITPDDVGMNVIRVPGWTIEICDVAGLDSVIRPEDVGMCLHGMANKGFSGAAYYWEANQHYYKDGS